MTDDPRYQHLQTQPYLRGVLWVRSRYTTYSPRWDHDHCVACWAKFMEQDDPTEEIEHEGWTTTALYIHGARYEWVCLQCFADFREAMGWVDVS